MLVKRSHPAVKQWKAFVEENGLKKPYKLTGFEDFARSLADAGKSKSTVTNYLSLAFNFELHRDRVFNHVRIEFRIKQMHRRVKKYATGNAVQATPLKCSRWMGRHRSTIIFMVTSGLRPVALQNLKSSARLKRKKKKVTGANFRVLKDKIESTAPRSVFVPCLCLGTPELCPLCTGLPAMPICRDRLMEAVKSVSKDHTPHATRRLHCMLVAKLLQSEHGVCVKSAFERREPISFALNKQLGWTPRSSTFLHYSAGFEDMKVSTAMKNMFRPIVANYLCVKR